MKTENDNLVAKVAAIILDKQNNEILEENQKLRVLLDDAKKELRECLMVELVDRRNLMVLAKGTLQGVVPSNNFTNGDMKVMLQMVAGDRRVRLQDFEHLGIRIGGVLAKDDAPRNGQYLNVTSLARPTARNDFFFAWPTRLFIASMLGLEENGDGPILHPIRLGGRYMEVDGICFSVSPQIMGADEQFQGPPVNRGTQEEEVTFHSIHFALFVEGAAAISMIQAIAAILPGNEER